VADRYIDLDAIKDDIKKSPRQGYTYHPLPHSEDDRADS
jgi:hypothetical protein